MSVWQKTVHAFPALYRHRTRDWFVKIFCTARFFAGIFPVVSRHEFCIRQCKFCFVKSSRVSYQLCVTATEQNILRSLVELDRQVKSMATADPKPDLRPLFARLDELTRALPPQSDPQLLHYLHKKSYEKARFFLEGRDAENAAGNCGHQ